MVVISSVSSDSDESLIFPGDKSFVRFKAGKEKEVEEPDGCCGCTARVCVFIWGVLLLLCGVIKMIGGLQAGGWKIDPKTGGGISAIIDICMGIFIIVVAICAIIGAAIRNRCMLMCVFSFVIVKIVVIIIFCVLSIIFIWDVVKMEEQKHLEKIKVNTSGNMSPNTARGIATGIVIAVVLVVIGVLAVVAACVKRAAGKKVPVE